MEVYLKKSFPFREQNLKFDMWLILSFQYQTLLDF